MRDTLRHFAGTAVVLVGVVLGPWPAAAQQAPPAPTFDGRLDLALPPPADTGKARPFASRAEPLPGAGCEDVLDCRLRVIGALQHNGAVELSGALLKW
jgi:hypothetical protein